MLNNSHEQANSNDSALVIQSRVTEQVVTQLEDYSARKLPGLNYYGQRAVILHTGEPAVFKVNSQRIASMPNGVPNKNRENQDAPTIYLTDKELVFTLCIAFQAILQDIEKILNKDLSNANHQVSINILVYAASEHPLSYSWHADGGSVTHPVTSLIYFFHELCNASLSIRRGKNKTLDADEINGFTTIKTHKGCCVTFANKVLEHRVHDLINQPRKDSNVPYWRGLIQFNFKGPNDLPPRMNNIPIVEKLMITKTKDETGTVIYKARLPRSKL